MTLDTFGIAITALEKRLAQYQSLLPTSDQQYIQNWITDIKQAYNTNHFNQFDNQNIEWHNHSFARYDWQRSITGFISEIMFLVWCIQHNLPCTLVPSIKNQQMMGIDAIITYPKYTVSVQIKTGQVIDATTNYPSVRCHTDWIQLPPPTIYPYHRIAIIDQDHNFIVISDYKTFQHVIKKQQITQPIINLHYFKNNNPYFRYGIIK